MNECDHLIAAFLAERDDGHLATLLESLLRRYQVINFKVGNGRIFWRARRCYSESGYDGISDVWAPPQNLCGAGRFNDLGESVLYASTTMDTALAEIDVKSGDLVHVVGIQFPRSSPRIACLGEFHAVHRGGRATFLPQEAASHLTRLLNSLGEAGALPLLYIDAFLADVVSSKDASLSSYVHTRAVGNAILRKAPGCSGLLYPSVKAPSGRNVMLRREAADRSFNIVSSSVIRVNQVRRYGYLDQSYVRQAVGVEAGRFRWAPAVVSASPRSGRLLFGGESTGIDVLLDVARFNGGKVNKVRADSLRTDCCS